MINHNLQRNYSENDLKNIITERRRRADLINKLIDNDIHMNMISESNSTLKDREKLFKNSLSLNNKKHLNNDYQDKSYINNNSQIYYNQNKLLNDDLNNYNDNTFNNNEIQNINKMIFNSYRNPNNLNKPFHCERRHFPLINNNGNFFKNISKFLVGNTNNNKLLPFQNNKRNSNNNNNYDKNRRNENNIKAYETPTIIKKSSSMVNIPLNPLKSSSNRKNNINNINEYSEKISYSIGNDGSKQFKYYNPKRFDYEGSRFGDKTYHYYLNSPMRGDISSNWKFPPIYYYNFNKEQKKNNSNY